MRNFITYEGLPISSGGAHKINGFPAKDIYHTLSTFVFSLTTAVAPVYVILESGKFSWKLVKMFGIPKWSTSNYLSSRKSKWIWHLSPERVFKAIELIEYNKHIALGVMWRFKFKDSTTGEILPGQEEFPTIDDRMHNSQIYWRHAENATIAVWFALPFESLDEVALRYIKLLQTHLPIKLSKHHWRMWHQSKEKLISKKVSVEV